MHTHMHTYTLLHKQACMYVCTYTDACTISYSSPQRRVVSLVKENKKAITLAVGDGANDVGMIKGAVTM